MTQLHLLKKTTKTRFTSFLSLLFHCHWVYLLRFFQYLYREFSGCAISWSHRCGWQSQRRWWLRTLDNWCRWPTSWLQIFCPLKSEFGFKVGAKSGSYQPNQLVIDSQCQRHRRTFPPHPDNKQHYVKSAVYWKARTHLFKVSYSA